MSLPPAHDQPRAAPPLLRLATLATVGVVAAGATGGLGGPLAVLCLLPLAASALGQAAAAGAALAVASAATLGLGHVLGLVRAPPPGLWNLALGLGALVLLSALFGLRLARRPRAQPSTPTANAVERLLGDQPGLLLDIRAGSVVADIYGAAPDGVDAAVLTAAGVPALARAEDRPAVLAALRTAADSGEAEVAFDTAGGAPVRLRLRRGQGGRLAGVLTDAGAETEQRRALETARARAEEANVAKSRFLADMSHELRTPLNAIIGFSDVMRARLFGELPERYRDYPESIHASGRHLLDLINDVLDLSKIEAAKYELDLEPGDAREPVDAALRLLRPLAEAKAVTLSADVPADALEATLDRRALTQITLNLGSNAVKFTPAGGVVTVSLAADGADLVLAVTDTGVGIAAEDLDRLGRPYEQAAAGRDAVGTGLGLSLVRGLAELHGGALTLGSAEGEGTTATVRLPVLAASERASGNVIPFTGGVRV